MSLSGTHAVILKKNPLIHIEEVGVGNAADLIREKIKKGDAEVVNSLFFISCSFTVFLPSYLILERGTMKKRERAPFGAMAYTRYRFLQQEAVWIFCFP